MSRTSEYTELFTSLQDLLAKDTSQSIIIIAVGSTQCVEALERSSANLFQESWRRKLRFWKDHHRPCVYFCTPRQLPAALLNAEALCEARPLRRQRSLAVVASRAVSSLDLAVGDQVRSLAVLGAKPHTPSSSSSTRSLTLGASSSFCDVPMAEWRRRQPSGYSLLTGPGVLVRSPAARLRPQQQDELDEYEVDAIRHHLETMERRAHGGRGSGRRWKASAAAILGVLTGGAATAAATAAGADNEGVSFRDEDGSSTLALAGIGLKATLVAAGWGLGAGAAAALLVYVVPWEAFFGHLRRLLAGFWTWICDLFSRLQDAVRSFRLRAEEKRRERRRGRGARRSSRSRNSYPEV